jgi:hypothetical protein
MTAIAVALLAGGVFVLIEARVAEPMLPLRLFRRRVFVGGNVVTLLSYMVSSGTFFFVAVSLQTTLGTVRLSRGWP